MLSSLLFLLICLAVTAYTYTRWKTEEKKRKELQGFLLNKLEEAKAAVNAYNHLLNPRDGFFRHSKMAGWRTQHEALHHSLVGKPIEKAKLEEKYSFTLKQFMLYFGEAESLREKHNERFLEQELTNYKEFFDTAAGKPLDVQQRTAILRDEDANLVIAGAGSGKTTTIVGKVKYAVDRYKTDPSHILLISFTKKSAVTLASRVNVEGIAAKTFHSFGIDVIRQSEGKKPSIFEEQQFKPFVQHTFTDLLKDEGYLETVTDYFTNFLKEEKSPFDFEDQGQYIQYLKDQNLRTYKAKAFTVDGRTTHRMEVVKSMEECKIANWLLFHSVDYSYEHPYEHETATLEKRQYKPDFTIFQGGKRVYIEHQALSLEGKVPPFFAKNSETHQQASQRYWDKIHWARKTHKDNGTKLIETYSHEMAEGTLFENLRKNLEAASIELKLKSPKQIWDIISHTASEEVESLITLFQTFITLMKSNDYSFLDLLQRNDKIEEAVTRERNRRFIGIVQPLKERYERHLEDRQEIDFNDMINKATALISQGRYLKRYDYIIIDEFQDISIGRYKLVKALRDANPGCRLFCVGDDWQSIYRFTGSDISLFKDFERYFGYSIKSRIETTYRFSDPLIKLSSSFILRNPNQTAKSLKAAFSERRTDYRFRYTKMGEQNDVAAVQGILEELDRKNSGLNQKTIFILGRYGFDIDRLADNKGTFRIHRNREIKELEGGKEFSRISDIVEYTPVGRPTIKAEFLTVHRSKGLEADIIIVINLNSGKLGFPSEMSDDRSLNLLLTEADQYENGEERRLFYVAMTRAKELVYFVANEAFKSKFISEIESGSADNTTQKKCPRCKTADVVVRKKGLAKNGNKYTFLGCTNYHYGCGHTEMVWENSRVVSP